MGDRGANIDLVFRNGLIDYEELPPPEVWDNIQPAIKVKHERHILLKTAAAVAVVATLSFLAFRLGKESVPYPQFYSVAMNIEANSPVLVPPTNTPLISPVRERQSLNIADKEEIVPIEDGSQGLPGETIRTTYVSDIQNMNIATDRSKLQTSPFYIAPVDLNNIPFEFVEAEPVFIPENISIYNKERWSIGALASPTYFSRAVSNSNALTNQLDASEQPLLTYSGGVAISYQINGRFSVQAGVYYSSMGQELENVSSYSGFQKYVYTKGRSNFNVLTSSGIVSVNNPDVFLTSTVSGDRIQTAYTNDVFDPGKANLTAIDTRLLQKFSYLELPLVLRYKFIDKTVDFNLIGGVSYNLLLNDLVFALENGDKYPVGETNGLKPLSLSSSIGMGMEYSFSENLAFNIEPTLRYYINPFTNLGGSNSHPYSFGLFSGLSYKF